MKNLKYLLLIMVATFMSVSSVNASENETFYSKVVLGRFANDNWVQVGQKTSNTNILQLTGIYEYYYYPLWLGFYGNKSTVFEPGKIYNLSFRINYPTANNFDWKKAMQYANMEINITDSIVNYCTMNVNNLNYSEFTCEFTVTSNTSSYYEFNVNWWSTNLYSMDIGYLLDSLAQSLSFDLSLSSNTDYGGQIVSQNEIIIGQNQQIIDSNNEIKNAITDETSPDTSGLSNAAGWLPPGPLDNLLNLPLSMFNAISRDLSSTCSPVELPLPYINENLTLPCMSSFYEGIKINSFMDWIGIIASGLMLYSYLMKLYKWVDDTLTFRENNHQDWGGV